MRISDWSSDVCSSDLRAITQTSTELDATRRALTDHRAAASNVIQALSTRFDAVLHEFLPGIGAGEIKLDGKGLSLKVQMGGERSTAAIDSLKIVEIGRASCRERGCRDV